MSRHDRFIVLPFALAALAAVGASAAGGCAPHTRGDAKRATQPELRARAAFLFDCPEEHVKTSTVDEKTRIARGCGKQAVFFEECDAPSRGGDHVVCAWVADPSFAPR